MRKYQCLFQMCSNQLLLNKDFDFNKNKNFKNLSPWLKKSCNDQQKPKREEIDPAVLINHSMIDKGRWKPSAINHPLREIADDSLKLYEKTIEARNILIYRPFFLYKKGPFWKDSKFIDLMPTVPSADEIEQLYKKFMTAISDWYSKYGDGTVAKSNFKDETLVSELLKKEVIKNFGNNLNRVCFDYKIKNEEQLKDRLEKIGTYNIRVIWDIWRQSYDSGVAAFFIKQLFEEYFEEYKDKRDNRPTETILLTYARMLNSNNESLLNDIRDYRNKLLDVQSLKKLPKIYFKSELSVGKF